MACPWNLSPENPERVAGGHPVAVFPQNGGVLALAGNQPGQQGVAAGRSPENALAAFAHVEHLGAERLRDPADIVVIFRGVERAGRINQDAAPAKGRPGVGQDAALAGCAESDRFRGPFRQGAGILSEHALAGARNVREEDVENRPFPAEDGRIEVRHADAGVAPAADIAPEDRVPVPHDLIGQQRKALAEALTKGGRGIGSLPAGGCAQIQHLHAGLQLRQHAPEQLADKHR